MPQNSKHLLPYFLGRDFGGLKRRRDKALGIVSDRQEQMLGTDIVMLEFFALRLRRGQQLPSGGRPGSGFALLIARSAGAFARKIDAETLEDISGNTVAFRCHTDKHMDR